MWDSGVLVPSMFRGRVVDELVGELGSEPIKHIQVLNIKCKRMHLQ